MASIPPERLAEERRIAHTGALAHWASTCARHPWRIVLGWILIFVVLGGLNAAFHGTLVNEFKVPGTDFQKATDLIDAKFKGQKGAALRVVLAAPDGQRLDTPERKAAIAKMLSVSQSAERTLDENAKDASTITDPLAKNSHQLAKSGRIAFFDVQFDQTGFELPRADVVNVEDHLRSIGESAGVQVEY